MKPRQADEVWICQICGTVKETREHHLVTQRHKMNEKKIEDAMAGEPIKRVPKDSRWGK